MYKKFFISLEFIVALVALVSTLPLLCFVGIHLEADVDHIPILYNYYVIVIDTYARAGAAAAKGFSRLRVSSIMLPCGDLLGDLLDEILHLFFQRYNNAYKMVRS